MREPETPLADLDWIPRNRLAPLARLGLSTLRDLIEHYPRRYEDRRRFDRFPDEEMERPVCLCGVVTKTSIKRFGGWRRMFEITFENESAGILSQPLTCRWFNMPFIQRLIVVGQRLVIFGRPKKRGRQIVIDHPEFETVEDDEETSIHMNRIAPVYPAGDGVSPRLLRNLIFRALEQADLESVPNLLPAPKVQALQSIHFPVTFEELEVARRQLVREEFFAIQLVIQTRRNDWRRLTGAAKAAKGRLLDRLLRALPYSLTDSQVEVISEIRRDLAAPRRMNRLLQGDVGIRQDTCRPSRDALGRRSGLADRVDGAHADPGRATLPQFQEVARTSGNSSRIANRVSERGYRSAAAFTPQARFGERTRPRVHFPASRRTGIFGGTPETARAGRVCSPNHHWDTCASLRIEGIRGPRAHRH